MEGPLLAAQSGTYASSSDLDLAGEPAPKRLQKSKPENERPTWPSTFSRAPSNQLAADNTLSANNRRRSGIRENKAPLGPRPLDFSRRVPSDTTHLTASSPRRSYFSNNGSEPFLGLSARKSSSGFDFAQPPMATQGGNTLLDPALASAAPVERPNALVSDGDAQLLASFNKVSLNESTPNGSPRKQQARAAGGGLPRPRQGDMSPIRQKNPALRAAQLSTGSAPGAPLSTPLSIKTRRQTQFPPSVAVATDPKQPRKSIGPGLVVTNPKERSLSEVAPRSRPLIPPNDPSATKPQLTNIGGSQAPKIGSSGPTIVSNIAPTPPTVPRPPRLQTAQRTASSGQVNQNTTKAKPLDSEPRPALSRNPSSKQQRVPTPSSSSNKRQSAVIGGLGARTISPTDARRLKRASEVFHPPPPPPMPSKSPSPELYFRAGAFSPPVVRQRSRTPPSSRATPEVNHRLSSGRLSSRSSFSSLRPPSASQQRASLIPPMPGAPTATPRNVQSSGGGHSELVPPVPAIPKAFESPTDTMKEPFFHNVLDSTASSTPQRVATVSLPQPPEARSARILEPLETRQKRGATFGSHYSASRIPPTQDDTRKRVSQQVRLPPINLLPLSDPTTAKIESLAHRTGGDGSGGATPPPRRNITKTPSTPMTASKATFSSSDLQFPTEFNRLPPLRTSLSFAAPKSESSTPLSESDNGLATHPLTASSSNSRSMASLSIPNSHGRTLMEPFLESPNAAQEDNEVAEQAWSKEPRLNNSRLRISTTASREVSGSQQPSPAKDGEVVPQSSTSLRHKMSFGWRRSSSKASHNSQQIEDGKQTDAPESAAMLPPKLPASAAWNHSGIRLTPTSTSSQRSSAHELEPTLRSSQGAYPSEKPMSRVNARKVSQTGDVEKTPTREPAPGASKTSSFFSPMQKMLGSKSVASSPRPQTGDVKLDRDDLAAEDEMRRLASRRKDFESAAKEMDELKKRATPKDVLSPGQACRAADLNIFERGEIIDYKEVYFCGSKNTTKFAGDLASQSSNFGFDDDRGDYNIVMGDHLAYRYEMVDLLGKGSFGQVVRCIDHKTGKLVAIKIIRNKKRFHQQALVEVNILQRLRDWDPQNKHSMINFTQSFYFRGHLCISTELLGINLYEFIKAHDFRGFSLKLIRRFTKQMLNSLCLLQTRKVIHCDLKPENILLAHPLHSEVKVIDFGSSCFENEKVYTYIQSRFYRSPEVILGMDYGMPIDMWSLGCILAELLTGYPIFPGENEQEQLACIMEVFGPPEKHLIEKSTRRKVFFDSLGKPRVTVSSKGKRRRPSSKTLQQALKCDDDAFVDFIAKCLRWDPERRLKPDEALSHEFVTGIKKQTRTKVANGTPATASPAKRFATTATTPARPLPEPPMTSYKNGLPVNTRAPSSSPVKLASAPRRHSVMPQAQNSVGVKRNSSGAAVVPGPGSAAPRSAPRSTSGKPDYASAAAIASLRPKP